MAIKRVRGILAMLLGWALAGAAMAAPATAYYELASLTQPDGRVLHVGGFGRYIGGFEYAVVAIRLNADGSYDTSFNGTGVAILPIWHSYEFASAIALQADGKIVIGGEAFDPAHPGRDCHPAFCWSFPFVMRLNSDGTLDRSFNGTGRIVLNIGGANSSDDIEDAAAYFGGIEIESDGRITMFGYQKTLINARLNPDGTLDTTSTLFLRPSEYVPTRALVGEFYNAARDHYFLTWMPAEIEALASGAQIQGWTITGRTFKTFAQGGAGYTPVCRFYIPPAGGDSHFFGRGVEECGATAAAHPNFVLEDAQFMHMRLPVEGRCPAQTVAVYRLFNQRADANHRYVTDTADRDAMIAQGWIAEGDGPDRVTLCAPD
ncbi:MAG: hypothetical protein U1F10_13025 [Burkholderiales bacterium]